MVWDTSLTAAGVVEPPLRVAFERLAPEGEVSEAHTPPSSVNCRNRGENIDSVDGRVML